MLEFEKKHKRGKNTFIYTFMHHGWLFTLFGIGLIYTSWAMVYGPLIEPVSQFLGAHEDWYISNSLLGLWILLLGISFFIVAYLLASVHYRYYKFILDDYALHLHRGWFFIRETTIPYQQISNVHIERPYHYRLCGVAQIDVVTAADKGMDKTENHTKKFLIPVIDIKIARQLSRQLLESAAKIRNGESVYEKDDDENEDDSEDEPDDELLDDGLEKVGPHSYRIKGNR